MTMLHRCCTTIHGIHTPVPFDAGRSPAEVGLRNTLFPGSKLKHHGKTRCVSINISLPHKRAHHDRPIQGTRPQTKTDADVGVLGYCRGLRS